MTDDDLKNLRPGDIIRHKNSATSMVVTDNCGTYCIAVRIAHVSNPIEWDLVIKQGNIAPHIGPSDPAKKGFFGG